jgi:hypothetical protein
MVQYRDNDYWGSTIKKNLQFNYSYDIIWVLCVIQLPSF